MKVVLWLAVLCALFIEYIQAENTKPAYRISSPVEYQVIQRGARNESWVEIKITASLLFSKSGPLEYRLDKKRSWEKLIGEWQNQNFLSRTKIPAGGWHRLEIREVGNSDHRSQVVQFGVGEIKFRKLRGGETIDSDGIGFRF